MEPVKKYFTEKIIFMFHMKVQEKKFFVDMDKTAIFFDCKPKNTVNMKGDKTVSIRVGAAEGKRLTLCVSVGFDGTMLLLFVIFEATPGDSLERSLPRILSDGMHGCCQVNGWMDEGGMGIEYNKVWKPYVEGRSSPSMLLLDDLTCHIQDVLLDEMKQSNSIVPIIPPGYTSVLQPCDVGIIKTLKTRLPIAVNRWRFQRYESIDPSDRVQSPGRKDICDWLKTIWDEPPTRIVENSFRASAYAYNENFDYSSLNTESESEVSK